MTMTTNKTNGCYGWDNLYDLNSRQVYDLEKAQEDFDQECKQRAEEMAERLAQWEKNNK